MAVKPIPDGYHTVTPCLTVQGAAKLIDFLKAAFGATEKERIDTYVCLGDIVGRPGRMVIHQKLPSLVKSRDIHLVVANAENIAAGYSTAAQVVAGWMTSTGHCNNIMNGNYKHLGVGYYYAAGATYKHYWTQDFGKN